MKSHRNYTDFNIWFIQEYSYLSFQYEPHAHWCHLLATPLPPALVDPCIPSPCGSNAVCKEFNSAGSCTCLPNYTGNPYEGCRPECVLNSDCPANLACINTKCRDPCPGSCGRNALCQVVNHLPVCNCYPRYTGDAFSYCTPVEIGTITLNRFIVCRNCSVNSKM